MYWIYESYINIIVFRIYCTYDKQYFSQHEFYQRASILIIQVRFFVIVGVSYILCLEPINPLGLSTMVSFKAEQGEPKVRGERAIITIIPLPPIISPITSRHHDQPQLFPEDSSVDWELTNSSKIWDWYQHIWDISVGGDTDTDQWADPGPGLPDTWQAGGP